MGFQQIISEAKLLELFGISRGTLDSLRYKGLPYIRLTRNNRVYFEDDVVSWLREHSVKYGVQAKNNSYEQGTE